MEIVRTPPAQGRPAPGGPPVFVNTETHWWDGSQVYGSTRRAAAPAARGRATASCASGPTAGCPWTGATGIELTGVNGNWWMGLSLLHTLFAREHNAICAMLAHRTPTGTTSASSRWRAG